MILLLRAAKEEISARPTWNKQASGLTRADLFDSLIRVLVPSQKAQNISTLTKYLPKYLDGTRPYSKNCYPFNDAKFITKARNRFTNKGELELAAMKNFCYEYLNMDSSNLEFLVGGIIDTALADDSFKGLLFTGSKWITKDLLEQETEYNLQAFLLSVWYHIVVTYNNAGDAQGAYEAWTDRANPLTIKTTIGDRFVDKIHVNTDDVQFIKLNAKAIKSGILSKRDTKHTTQKSIQTALKAKNIIKQSLILEQVESENADHADADRTEVDRMNVDNTDDHAEHVNAENTKFDTQNSDGMANIKPVANKDSIKFDMNKRYLLDECDIQDYTKRMKPSPGRLMILSLYFITLEYNGEYYVALDYTSYVPDDYSNGYAVNSGLWTVPHTSIFVDTGRIKPTTIKEVKNEYEKFMAQGVNQDRMAKAQEDLLYSLGFLNGEAHTPEKGREYIEYKESHTITKEMRCFYIREFFIHGINKAGMINLVDPEGLHRHYIVPLSLLRSEKPINGTYYFKGRPLPHNLSDVFINTQNLAHILSCVNKVQPSDMLIKVSGILFVITISDAAEIYREIKDKHIAGIAEQILPFIFDKCMIDFNVRYYSADKSQVIGLIPEDELDFTVMLLELFEEITNTLVESKTSIALRCTALSCECLYGKIMGICDSKPSFVGESFDKLCHMADETRYVQSRIEGEFSGILFGWNERDKLRFEFSNTQMVSTDRFNEYSRNMNFRIFDGKDYLEEKRKTSKRASNGSVIRKISKNSMTLSFV